MANDQYLDLAREHLLKDIATILCIGLITKEQKISEIVEILKEYDFLDVVMALAVAIRNLSESLAKEIREDEELMDMYGDILDEIESKEKDNPILDLITDIIGTAIKYADSSKENLEWPKPKVNLEKVLEMKNRISALTDDLNVVILALLKYIALNNKYKAPDQLVTAMYEAVEWAARELR